MRSERMMWTAAAAVMMTAAVWIGWASAQPADRGEDDAAGRVRWEYARYSERFAPIESYVWSPPGGGKEVTGFRSRYEVYANLGGRLPEKAVDVGELLTLFGHEGWEMVEVEHEYGQQEGTPQLRAAVWYFKRALR